ncbi:MAG: stage III sporulation protein AA [Christensenellales bacterium]|jgi:stage III sporulation protein AA
MTALQNTLSKPHTGKTSAQGDWRETLAGQMCQPFSGIVKSIGDIDASAITELRFRSGRRPSAAIAGRERELSSNIITPRMLSELLSFLCNFSVYSKQHQISEGFITLKGGFRAGLAGSAIFGSDGALTLADISGIAIRITREIIGCAENAVKRLFSGGICSVLIISPPGLGKTTILRDMIRILSNRGSKISVADERGEIAAMFSGEHSMDLGRCSDVIDGCAKDIAISMMLRSMSPQIIAADEIGRESDAAALREAALSGVKVIATAHGASARDICLRPYLRPVLDSFDKLLVLGGAPGNIVSFTDIRGNEL